MVVRGLVNSSQFLDLRSLQKLVPGVQLWAKLHHQWNFFICLKILPIFYHWGDCAIIQWNLPGETTAMRDHLSWQTTYFWQKDLHFNITKPATKDHLPWQTTFLGQWGSLSRHVQLCRANCTVAFVIFKGYRTSSRINCGMAKSLAQITPRQWFGHTTINPWTSAITLLLYTCYFTFRTLYVI